MALADNKTKIQALLDGINALPNAGSGTPELQEKTVTPTTAKQTVAPDSGYDGLSKVTVNAMPTATQATPSISVTSGGLITASATQTAGYVAAGTKTMTQQLTTQAAQTITPGTSNKTIASGRYLTGTQTIMGDANLIAENIKKGVSIFGVAGALEASGGGGLYSKSQLITWTPTTNVETPTIAHNLGVVPDGFVVTMRDSNYSGNIREYNVLSYVYNVDWYYAPFDSYIATTSALNGIEESCVTQWDSWMESFCTASDITLWNSWVTKYIYPAGTTYEILVYKR